MKNILFLSLMLILIISISFLIEITHLQSEEDRQLNVISTLGLNNQTTSEVYKNGEKSVNQDWYTRVIEDIKEQEYEINWKEKVKAYQSPNRAKNLRFTYYKDGFSVKPRTTKIPKSEQDLNNKRPDEIDYITIEDWEVKLKLLGIKNGKKIIPFTGREFNVEKNYAKIEDKNLKIEYINNEEGMRQNFIVKNKPADNKKPLEIVLKVESNLKVFVGRDAISFRNEQSQVKLYYKGLKVWDNQGKELVAYFRKQNDDEFSLVVNTENAEYPITIDPLSTNANWTLSAISFTRILAIQFLLQGMLMVMVLAMLLLVRLVMIMEKQMKAEFLYITDL